MTQPAINPKRILLVEPYDDSREVLTTLLEYVGHQVTGAKNATDALALLSMQLFDVVLTEICGLEMSGRDFYRMLRELPNTEKSRVVALTGYCTDSQMEELLHSGLNAVLLKPSSLPQILDVIT